MKAKPMEITNCLTADTDPSAACGYGSTFPHARHFMLRTLSQLAAIVDAPCTSGDPSDMALFTLGRNFVARCYEYFDAHAAFIQLGDPEQLRLESAHQDPYSIYGCAASAIVFEAATIVAREPFGLFIKAAMAEWETANLNLSEAVDDSGSSERIVWSIARDLLQAMPCASALMRTTSPAISDTTDVQRDTPTLAMA